MEMTELLAWAEQQREEHLDHLKTLRRYRGHALNMMARETAMRHERTAITQFELVIDGLRKEVEHGASSARDGTDTSTEV